MDENSNYGALIAGIKENIQTKVIPLGTVDGETVEIIAASRGAAGVDLRSIKSLRDEYRKRPERTSGTSAHDTVESFIEHVKTFKKDNSVIFASREKLSLTALYDYHTASQPDNLGHAAKFAPQKSRQLKTWLAGDGKPMSQAEFAAFIENNILDLTDAPAGDVPIYIDIAAKLATTIASPSKLLELARGLSIHESSTAKSHVNPSTGEVILEYTTAHADGKGEKLKIPGLFMIAVPVFEGGPLYRVLVRLRYRLEAGKVRWWFDIYQIDASIDSAFEDTITKIVSETEVTLYRGASEKG